MADPREKPGNAGQQRPDNAKGVSIQVGVRLRIRKGLFLVHL